MGYQKNTITLNGKLYNAKTGVVLGAPTQRVAARQNIQVIHDISSGPKKSLTHPSAKPTHQPPVHHKRANTAREIHQAPQHTRTLMRTAVKKTQFVTNKLNKNPTSSTTVAAPTKHIDTIRAERAKTVPKSRFISRFNDFADLPKFEKKTASLRVKTQPLSSISHHHTTPLSDLAGKPTSMDDFFAQALSSAKSHEQVAPKRARGNHKLAKKMGIRARTLNISAALLSILILGSFFAAQNIPNLSVRLAATKAGIHASIPNYKPSGYAISRSVQASPGQIVINFHSNSDSRGFRIIQSTSNWNSEALLNNFVASSQQPYERISRSNGKIVYIYGDSNATWVDGGIWYRIEGSSSLNSDQLLRLAGSM